MTEAMQKAVDQARSEGYSDGFKDGATAGRDEVLADFGPFKNPWDDDPSWVQRLYSLPSDAGPRP